MRMQPFLLGWLVLAAFLAAMLPATHEAVFYPQGHRSQMSELGMWIYS